MGLKINRKDTIFIIGSLFLFYTLSIYLGYPSVEWFDTGELITAGFFLGNSHPPGQHIYAQISNLFLFLPIGSIPWRITLISIISGTLTILILLLLSSMVINSLELSKTLFESYYPVIIIVLITIYPPIFSQIIRVEVYALGTLILFGLLYLAFSEISLEKKLLLGNFIGIIALGIHLQIAIAGIVLFFLTILIYNFCELKKMKLKVLIYILLGVIPSFLSFLYLPIRATKSEFSWGLPYNLYNFLRLITFKEYSMNITGDSSTQLLNIYKLMLCLKEDYSFSIFLLILSGLVFIYLFMKKRGGIRLIIWYLFGSLILMLLEGGGLKRFFIINTDTSGKLSSAITFILFFGISLWTISLSYSSIRNFYLKKGVTIVKYILPLIPLIKPISKFDFHKWSPNNYIAEELGIISLSYIPHNSLLILNNDHTLFPIFYLQSVEGVNPLVPSVWSGVSASKWYLIWLQKRYPKLIIPYVNKKIKLEGEKEWNIYQKVTFTIMQANLWNYKIVSELPCANLPNCPRGWIKPYYPWYSFQNELLRTEDPTTIAWEMVENFSEITYRIKVYSLMIKVNYNLGRGNWQKAIKYIVDELRLGDVVTDEYLRVVPERFSPPLPPGPPILEPQFIVDPTLPEKTIADLIIRSGYPEKALHLLTKLKKESPGIELMIIEITDHINKGLAQKLWTDFSKRYRKEIQRDGLLWLIIRRMADMDVEDGRFWLETLYKLEGKCNGLKTLLYTIRIETLQKLPQFLQDDLKGCNLIHGKVH